IEASEFRFAQHSPLSTVATSYWWKPSERACHILKRNDVRGERFRLRCVALGLCRLLGFSGLRLPLAGTLTKACTRIGLRLWLSARSLILRRIRPILLGAALFLLHFTFGSLVGI